MNALGHRSRILILCGLLALGPAGAASLLPESVALFERLQADRRAALAYLTHDNADLGGIALERWRDTLQAGRKALVSGRDDPALARLVDALDAGLAAAAEAAKQGDTSRAAALAEEPDAALEAWRRASGTRLFSDCIVALGAAQAGLDRNRGAEPDLTQAPARAEITAAAATAQASIARCDGDAPPAIRANPEFRRLVDGMQASIGHLPRALETRDRALLHRILIELRAFERLLAFRYG